MLGSSRASNAGSTDSIYGRKNNPGPQFGDHATCELCESSRRCFDEYGILACRECHRDLLPGEGVL